jgi:hypothetical protein
MKKRRAKERTGAPRTYPRRIGRRELHHHWKKKTSLVGRSDVREEEVFFPFKRGEKPHRAEVQKASRGARARRVSVRGRARDGGESREWRVDARLGAMVNSADIILRSGALLKK